MFQHVTGRDPEKIAIIGCGPSMYDYVGIKASDQSHNFHVDEVWGINKAGCAVHTDLDFHMDDYAFLQGQPNSPAAFLEKERGVPVFMPRETEKCPDSLEFPLSLVLKIPGARKYFNHTAAYAMAYAIAIGVKEICLFGVDYISDSKPYTAGGSMKNDPYKYMACMAFWSGIAAARGINVIVTPNSPFLDTDEHKNKQFYGYLTPPIIRHEGE